VLTLRGDEAGPLTVRLEPTGTLTGRVVDAEGRPWAGLGLNAYVNLKSMDSKTLPYEALHPFGFAYHLLSRPGTTDADGQFRVEGLIPGLTYGLEPAVKVSKEKVAKPILFFATRQGLSVESGQTKDLGLLQSTVTPEKLPKE
jgi:hypothetical protein